MVVSPVVLTRPRNHGDAAITSIPDLCFAVQCRSADRQLEEQQAKAPGGLYRRGLLYKFVREAAGHVNP
ncbi:MAG: hypothetical protein HFJ79_03845 [Clostridiales bacterium]|jgi:hypothetical protein|nr:hypothetical protein [Clostridiales bacterium]